MAKKQKRKPRNEYIYATTTHGVSEIVVTIDSSTGVIQFGQPMTNVYSEVTYDRVKAPKVLSRIPQRHPEVSHNQSPALRQNYDFLCAVDTNTRTLNGQMVSVTAVVTFRQYNVPTAVKIETGWRLDVPFCLAVLNVKVSPEKFGWLEAIAYLEKQNRFKASDRVGVVVDSDLGNLKDYNERKKPVYRNYVLPPNVRLIYASSDAGVENITNRALKTADYASTQVLKKIEGHLPFGKKTGDNEPYDGLAFISIDAIEGC